MFEKLYKCGHRMKPFTSVEVNGKHINVNKKQKSKCKDCLEENTGTCACGEVVIYGDPIFKCDNGKIEICPSCAYAARQFNARYPNLPSPVSSTS